MLPVAFKMPLVAFVPACAVLALATIASAPSRAEPTVPYDRCAYMHHESKAYKACVADEAAAKQRTEAVPVLTPKPKPKAQPGS